MLDPVVRKLTEFGYERSLRQFFLGNSVRVGPDQLPATYAAYRRAAHALDLEPEHDVYVWQSAGANARVIGAGRPMIVVDSALEAVLDPEEQRAVMAHEVGHVLSDHVLYGTALNILVLAARLSVPFPFALPLRAVRSVLLEWSRAAELSCDRAAVLAVRDPRIVCRLLMVTAAGRPSKELSLDAFMAQAMEYENWEDPHDRVRRFFFEVSATHTNAVRRANEIMRWVQSGDYDRIIGGDYVRRGAETDPRAEAGDAADFYAARFKSMLEDAGEQAEKLGHQVADWIRR
jgi:Zn-dependent protease with chaperone function